MSRQDIPASLEDWALVRAAKAWTSVDSSLTDSQAKAAVQVAILDGIEKGLDESGIVKPSDLQTFKLELGALLGLPTDPEPGRIQIEEGVRQLPKPTHHTDDEHVTTFALRMRQKLAKKREQGRGGWDSGECDAVILSRMLREHVAKGDPVDVANFAMMLSERGEAIHNPYRFIPVGTEPPPLGIYLHTYRTGERKSTIAMLVHTGGPVPSEPGAQRARQRDPPEWVTMDGRTTTTHHSFKPPTHYAVVQIPALPKD